MKSFYKTKFIGHAFYANARRWKKMTLMSYCYGIEIYNLQLIAKVNFPGKLKSQMATKLWKLRLINEKTKEAV